MQILFFCIFFFLPPPQVANTATIPTPTTISTAGSQHNHQSTTKLPPRLSLLLPALLSPLQPFLLPLTADSGHRHLSRSFLSHRPDILSTSETPKPGNFLFPALPPSSLRPLHAEFISACSGRIIKLSLGLARTPFIFLEKNNIQKISKIILKNL
jgi:hypothetical protein